MDAFLKVVRDLALLIARIVAGVVLVAHGWWRWQIAGIDKQVSVLTDAGLPGAYGLAVATVIFEVIGGALLIFGLATPVIGLGMAVMNAVIIATTKSGAPFYLKESGWEYNAILAALGLIFLAFGSGRAGLDNLFIRPKEAAPSLIADDTRER